MSAWLSRVLLSIILLAAAALRLTGVDWDNYDHHHPDERYITWVATTIEWPETLSEAFDPVRSSFNPFYWRPGAISKGIQVPQDEARKFAYGHLPLYLGVAFTRLAESLGPYLASRLPSNWLLTSDLLNGAQLVEFRHLTAVSRAVTALVDLCTVVVLYLLGSHLFSRAVGIIAAAFLALNVMHIQLAHFFTFDPYMTFFATAALYFMVLSLGAVRPAQGRIPVGSTRGEISGTEPSKRDRNRQRRFLLLAAACVGLAAGSKFAAIMLSLPLALAVYLGVNHRRLPSFVILVGVAAATFLLTNPFSLLDLTCEVITPSAELGPVRIPALNWRSCFLENMATQGAMVRGDLRLPFTRQYAGTLPYVYPIEMQLRWGMGWPLGLVAFAGLGWATWQGGKAVAPLLRRKRPKDGSGVTLLHALDWRIQCQLVMLGWVLPFFLVTASFYVKFMRYLQPVIPCFMLFTAAMVWQWRKGKAKWILTGGIILMTGLYALSFVGIYSQDHPWTAASRWIYANVEPGTLILSEQWDDALPVSMRVNGENRRRSEYEDQQLAWLTKTGAKDDKSKLAANLDALAVAGYLTLVSNRTYGVVPRLPELYPLSSQYYQLLFDGSLGYEVAAVFGRFPNLAGYHLKPDSFGWPGLRPPGTVRDYLSQLPGLNYGRADESFTVYDQPLTIIFKNTGSLTATEMLARFQVSE